jgi:hypothetical protein
MNYLNTQDVVSGQKRFIDDNEAYISNDDCIETEILGVVAYIEEC